MCISLCKQISATALIIDQRLMQCGECKNPMKEEPVLERYLDDSLAPHPFVVLTNRVMKQLNLSRPMMQELHVFKSERRTRSYRWYWKRAADIGIFA